MWIKDTCVVFFSVMGRLGNVRPFPKRGAANTAEIFGYSKLRLLQFCTCWSPHNKLNKLHTHKITHEQSTHRHVSALTDRFYSTAHQLKRGSNTKACLCFQCLSNTCNLLSYQPPRTLLLTSLLSVPRCPRPLEELFLAPLSGIPPLPLRKTCETFKKKLKTQVISADFAVFKVYVASWCGVAV